MFNEATVATTLTINVKYDLQNLTMKFDRRLELRMTFFTFTVLNLINGKGDHSSHLLLYTIIFKQADYNCCLELHIN